MIRTWKQTTTTGRCRLSLSLPLFLPLFLSLPFVLVLAMVLSMGPGEPQLTWMVCRRSLSLRVRMLKLRRQLLRGDRMLPLLMLRVLGHSIYTSRARGRVACSFS